MFDSLLPRSIEPAELGDVETLDALMKIQHLRNLLDAREEALHAQLGTRRGVDRLS